MDIITHALVGRVVGRVFDKTPSPQSLNLAALGGVAPDLLQIPLYLYLGHINDRPFNYPDSADWVGARAEHPLWMLWWLIPHSLFFVLLIIYPLIRRFPIPRTFMYAYISHIILDIPSHTGEWATAPLYPIPLSLDGVADVWDWYPLYYIIFWIPLILLLRYLSRRRK